MKRDTFTASLDLGRELIVDNFAGGGGASEGIEQALNSLMDRLLLKASSAAIRKYYVDVAINHDGEALAMHKANHPRTAHYEEDVFTVHPGFVTKHLPIGLAWFSPDCKHFSKAKGKKPVDKKIRGLAWVTLKWATFQVPRVIILENVEEFQDWGPIGADHKPIKKFKGRTFKAFIAAMTTGLVKGHPDTQEIFEALGSDFPIERLNAGLGYKAELKVLRACDYGTPTIRKRLFVIFRRDGRPIVWPEATHGDPKTEAVKSNALQPWRTAAECIDWSIPCPSIFERKRPLKDATLRRIARGIMKFVVNNPVPFIVGAGGPIYAGKPVSVGKPLGTLATESHRNLVVPTLMHVTHQGSDRTQSLDHPVPTVTGAHRGEQALITAHISTYYGEKGDNDVRGSEMEGPIGTQTTENRHALVSAFLAKHYGGVTGIRADVPTGTVTSSDHHSLVTSNLVKLRGTSQDGQPVDEPLHTVSAQGTHFAEVRAFLISYYGTDQNPGLDKPMPTATTKDRLGLITIKGEDYAIVDIGMRMLTPRELARAQGFPDTYILDPEYTYVDKRGKSVTKRLSKSAQVRMIGNSVCPPLARALVEANFGHEQELARVA